MELYLDSADVNEIKEAFELGFLAGLTTTPTFMHRHGITDIDGTIVELSKIVPVLQIEALGAKADEIVAEAKRQTDLGLDKRKTVYKIPVSMEGLKACKRLRDEDFLVNVHLVYTLQQAYMAMAAGATYVCPLVGRSQDQGLDTISLIEQCVETVNYYGYDTKIMFSSVRYIEHIRNALSIGTHTITAPWKVIKQLTNNNLTEVGTREFFEHTRLMTQQVRDLVTDVNPTVTKGDTIHDTLVKMTVSGFGAATVVDEVGKPIGIFTDGDLRRMIEKEGGASVNRKIGDLTFKTPKSIEANALLIDASNLFKDSQVDTLIVTENNKAVGMIDIQDLMKLDNY
jgi:TalC/MipB family fructose-6-phosphate aldolase